MYTCLLVFTDDEDTGFMLPETRIPIVGKFIEIKSQSNGNSYHGCETGLSVLYCDYLQGVSCGWLYTVQAMAVRLHYLYFNVIICRESAVAGCALCAGHGCEAGLSVLQCDYLQEVSCGRLYRPWL
jgi:hypothetical protein